MELKKIDINFPDTSYPFYYKKVLKEMGGYFAKIIKGDIYKKIQTNKPINLIIDLGANFGSASICFAIRYPNATILSLEPVKETYHILSKNIKPYKNILGYNCAASNKTGFSKIYIDNEKMGRSSLIKNHLNYSFNFSEKIKTIDFKEFLETNNIDKVDILKVDVEGSESDIFQTIKKRLNDINIIYIEIHGKDNIKNLTKLILSTHNIYEYNAHREDLIEAVFINKNF